MPGGVLFKCIEAIFVCNLVDQHRSKLSSIIFYGIECQKQSKDHTLQVLSHIYRYFVWDKISSLQWLGTQC